MKKLLLRMISSKKILEGCLLAVSRDTSEKWDLFMNGVEINDMEDPALSKEKYQRLSYQQHLIPLYKLAGYLGINLRDGLSSTSARYKQREVSTVMDDFPGFPKNIALFSTALHNCQEEWWTETRKAVVHTSLVIRDKKYVRIPSTELVIGDILCVSAGDIVAADARVIVCSPGTLIDISSITNVAHSIKSLQEKPTDLNPLYVNG